jgi:hypothetical protein
MTQQNNQITDQDLQMLLAQNPMAAEQLRRIIAERLVVELQTELATRNGNADATDALAAVEAVDGG